MGGFFALDGPFYRIGTLIADIMILSFVWLLFCIPLFTVGASTSALFYVVTRRISNKEGYLLRDFWKSFRENFKQSTICWLLIVFISGILLFNIYNIGLLGNMRYIIYPLQICIGIELALMSIYIFPIISRFDMKIKDILKTSFFMANKHIFTSVLCGLIGFGVIYLSLIYLLFSVVAMGTYAFCVSYFIVKVFKKYRPEMDAEEFIGESIERLDLRDSAPIYNVSEIPPMPEELEKKDSSND